MAKVEKIKNEHIDFDVFGSANVFLLFAKKFGNPLIDHIGANPNDVEALSSALLYGHQSYCKLFEKAQSVEDTGYILDRMDINELATAVMVMLGLKVSDEPKKK